MAKKKTNFKNLLDSLVDEDGIKTDVTVGFATSSLIETSLFAVATVIVSSLAYFSIRNAFTR